MLKQPADGGDLLKKRAGMIEEGAKHLVCDIHNYGCQIAPNYDPAFALYFDPLVGRIMAQSPALSRHEVYTWVSFQRKYGVLMGQFWMQSNSAVFMAKLYQKTARKARIIRLKEHLPD